MLKDIVLKQKLKKEELLKSKYVDRTKEPFAKKWLDSDLIKVVLGPRRAGKSVFSLLLLKGHDFMYFDFDDEVLAVKGKKVEIDPEYKSLPEKHGQLLNLLDQYLSKGGFPEVVVSNLDPADYLEVLFDSLLFKDVVKRHRVKFSTQISTLGSHLVNNFASLYTLNKLMKTLNLKSVHTVAKYASYLEEAYLIFSLSRYSPKSRQRIHSPKKVYVVDNGFVTAKAIQHSPDKGKLMENLVFTELVKRGLKPNLELFYYKTRNDREVDFVVKKGHMVTELIQVCYESVNSDVEQRETKALSEASSELNVKKLTVLTWDEEREVKRDGKTIQLKPLWKWLLNKTEA